MKKNSILASIAWILKRAIVFYILLFLAAYFIVDYKKVRDGYKVRVLNSMTPPSFTALLDFENGKTRFSSKELMEYSRYYKQAVEFFPHRADAYGMLGFCTYHLGNPQKAKDYYKKAITIQPRYFWFYYNLAVIHFQKKEFDGAAVYLILALEADPDFTIHYTLHSKAIYKKIFHRDPNIQKNLDERLIEGYQNVFDMLGLSLYQLNELDQMLLFSNLAIAKQYIREGRAYFYAGMAALKLNKPDKAVAFLKQYTDLVKDNADAYMLLAESYQMLGQQQKAYEAKERAKAISHQVNIYSNIADTVSLRLF